MRFFTRQVSGSCFGSSTACSRNCNSSFLPEKSVIGETSSSNSRMPMSRNQRYESSWISIRLGRTMPLSIRSLKNRRLEVSFMMMFSFGRSRETSSANEKDLESFLGAVLRVTTGESPGVEDLEVGALTGVAGVLEVGVLMGVGFSCSTFFDSGLAGLVAFGAGFFTTSSFGAGLITFLATFLTILTTAFFGAVFLITFFAGAFLTALMIFFGAVFLAGALAFLGALLLALGVGFFGIFLNW